MYIYMVCWRTGLPEISHLTILSKIFNPPNPPIDQTNVLNCSKGQRLHWELPPQQCVRKQRKLSKLILFSQSTVGRINHETTRITLGSLCTNQFAQRQSYCTRSQGERFLCTPQFYIRLDAEIAGSRVVLLTLFDSDVWDLSDSLSINLLWTTAMKAKRMQASLTLVGFSNIGENTSLVLQWDQFFLLLFFFSPDRGLFLHICFTLLLKSNSIFLHS